MGFADLFRPRWKHSDPTVRIQAVQNLDARSAWEVATTDPDSSVRKALLLATDVHTLLAHAALHDADPGVREVAVRHLAEEMVHSSMFALTDHLQVGMPAAFRSALKELGTAEEGCAAFVRKLLETDPRPSIKAALVPLYQDDREGLLALVRADPTPDLVAAAVEHLDEEDLVRIAIEAPAAAGLGIVKNLDEEGLVKVICHAVSEEVRRAAAERLDWQDGFVQVALSDAPLDLRRSLAARVIYPSDLEILIKKAKDPEIRTSAFDRYAGQVSRDEVAELAVRLLNDADPVVRALGVRHADEVGRLEKLARSDPDERVRAAAVGRVIDPAVVAAIAAQDANPVVREAAAKAVNQPWKEKAARYRDWEDPLRWKVVRAFAGEVSSRFPRSQVVLNKDEEEVYVRGRLDDVPIQVRIWAAFGSLFVSMRWENPLPDMDLTRDLSKKPRKARGGDWGEKDEVRLFLGPAIFVEGQRDDAQAMAAAWGVLPPEATEPVLEAMTRLDLSFAYFQREEAKASFEKSFYEMDDPVGAVLEVARILVAFFKAVGAAQLPPAIPALEAGDCKYCGARFNKQRRSTCPNCGAPVAW